ncbi:cyd operon protein YbgT [Pseudoduganella lurida]|uniref:Cyd operon protein YbgT n=1 Tax=Pseudoduganella lurida TaxID=1036180 RepID=A0A562RL75_9BURK|nr:cytochrome bd-I oxidase subunit CydX [Pseudoduganella lurida]TWI69789.1 cyd operon protein YbgT [Pseudoduganella lurida]
MWYFAWLLGLPLAAAFAVMNAMWFELMDDAKRQRAAGLPPEGRRAADEGFINRR